MKVIIDGYEVEIKVKNNVSGKFDSEKTKFLLNELSMVYNEAGKWDISHNMKSLGDRNTRISNEIFEQLKVTGFYGNI